MKVNYLSVANVPDQSDKKLFSHSGQAKIGTRAKKFDVASLPGLPRVCALAPAFPQFSPSPSESVPCRIINNTFMFVMVFANQEEAYTSSFCVRCYLYLLELEEFENFFTIFAFSMSDSVSDQASKISVLNTKIRMIIVRLTVPRN